MHLVKHCNSSDHPSMSEAGDNQLFTGSCLVDTMIRRTFWIKSSWLRAVIEAFIHDRRTSYPIMFRIWALYTVTLLAISFSHRSNFLPSPLWNVWDTSGSYQFVVNCDAKYQDREQQGFAFCGFEGALPLGRPLYHLLKVPFQTSYYYTRAFSIVCWFYWRKFYGIFSI